MASIYSIAMSYRKPADTPDIPPAPKVPRLEDGELHERKERWADNGQLPDDDGKRAMERFRKEALAGRFTRGELDIVRSRLRLPCIQGGLRDAVMRILDEAVPRDMRSELARDILEAKQKGPLTDAQIKLFRTMIEVQSQKGNLSTTDYVALFQMLGLEVKQG